MFKRIKLTIVYISRRNVMEFLRWRYVRLLEMLLYYSIDKMKEFRASFEIRTTYNLNSRFATRSASSFFRFTTFLLLDVTIVLVDDLARLDYFLPTLPFKLYCPILVLIAFFPPFPVRIE